MKSRSPVLKSILLRLCFWGTLGALVCFFPGRWAIHSGALSCQGLAEHPDTGVSACAPILRVESEESFGSGIATGVEACLPDDLSLNGSRMIHVRDWEFQHHLSGFGDKGQYAPLPIRAEMLHPRSGWSVQDVKANTVSLLDEEGHRHRYAFYVLPQHTMAWYSGISCCGKMNIFLYQTETPPDLDEPTYTYAIEDNQQSLERMYDVYAPLLRETEAAVRFFFLVLIALFGYLRCRSALR